MVHNFVPFGVVTATRTVQAASAFIRKVVGGLGLTGLITWVELRLKRVPGPWIDAEEIQFHGLNEFLTLSRESEPTHVHIVAWVD